MHTKIGEFPHKKRIGESMFFSLPGKIGESILNYFFMWSIIHIIF